MVAGLGANPVEEQGRLECVSCREGDVVLSHDCRAILAKYDHGRESLVEVLQDIQEAEGYLPGESLRQAS